MRSSSSRCMRSQMAYPHGRITMVPRTGPFSASSALATTSWYHRGKSVAWGVRMGALAMACDPIANWRDEGRSWHDWCRQFGVGGSEAGRAPGDGIGGEEAVGAT